MNRTQRLNPTWTPTRPTAARPLRRPRGPRRDRGLGLVELLIASALGALVLGGGMRMMLVTVSAEKRSEHKVNVAQQAALAASWIGRDLDRLHYVPGMYPLNVGSVEWQGRSYGGAAVQLTLDEPSFYQDDAALTVVYQFDPSTGILRRYVEGQESHAFPLGPGAVVVFSKVEQDLSFDSVVTPGNFANRLTFRITATSGSGTDGEVLTLVGSRSFETKVSLEAFPYWSPLMRPGA